MLGKPVMIAGKATMITQAKRISAMKGITDLYRSIISTPGGATPFK